MEIYCPDSITVIFLQQEAIKLKSLGYIPDTTRNNNKIYNFGALIESTERRIARTRLYICIHILFTFAIGINFVGPHREFLHPMGIQWRYFETYERMNDEEKRNYACVLSVQTVNSHATKCEKSEASNSVRTSVLQRHQLLYTRALNYSIKRPADAYCNALRARP